MLSNVNMLSLAILDSINNFVGPYIDKIMNYFDGLTPWVQAVIVLLLAIFTLIGLFVFIKKFIKLFLVLAILGAVFYYVYDKTTLLDNLFGTIIMISRTGIAFVI